MQNDRIIHSEKQSSAHQIESLLKEYKKRVGEVVHVSVSNRTTFEFPADLSQEEREIRIANYLKRHKPVI